MTRDVVAETNAPRTPEIPEPTWAATRRRRPAARRAVDDTTPSGKPADLSAIDAIFEDGKELGESSRWVTFSASQRLIPLDFSSGGEGRQGGRGKCIHPPS